jgi:leader peptidase (prepilin peptidase)/N-methyltransferase
LAGATGARACTHCGQPRERFTRSVIIELTVPLVFAFLLGRYGLSLYLGLISLYSAILILITVTDLEHRLIFNVVTIPAIFLAVVVAFTTPYLSWRSAMLGGGLAFVLVYLAWLLGTLVYGHGALGVGDITLATFLGLILGFPNIILSLIFGVFLGGLVAFILLVIRRINRSSFIPYGPFLTITGWIMLIWGDEIWRYYFA